MVNDKLLIFDSNETLLNNVTILSRYDYYTKKSYFIIPYKRLENNTYIACFIDVIDYFGDNTFMNFQYIYYNFDNNTVSFSENLTYILDEENHYNPLIHGSIGCALMNYNNSRVINCLYGLYDSFKIIHFDPENNFQSNLRKTVDDHKEDIRMFFDYVILPGNEVIIYCTSMNFVTECIKYNISINDYISFHNFTHGLYSFEIMNSLEYYEETDQVIYLVLGVQPSSGQRTIVVYYCDTEGNCSEKNYTFFGDISINDIYSRINLVIPKDQLNYSIFAYDPNSDQNLFDLDIRFELKCKNYFNYKKTWCLKSIPDGYFCNSTEDKTIDLCHENCLTCNESAKEDNNNCLTCGDKNIYYDLGNCRENCTNGFFFNEDQRPICKCTNNIECHFCSKNNKCINCNTDLGFYQKIDEEDFDGFVNCYKEPEGYYFFDNKYYPYFSSCKNCEEQGNIDDNKCIECKKGYEFKSDFEGDKNCYEICDYYYYFDENKIYHCTSSAECPSGYSKIISEQNKCVINDDTTDVLYSETYNISNNKSECNIIGYLRNECQISIPFKDMINRIRSSITNNEIVDLIIDIKVNGIGFTKFLNQTTLQLISLDKQYENNINTNISIIDIGECEDILRNNYNIGNKSILLYKIDKKIKGYNTLFVEYELYNPNNNSLLNLSFCN